MYTPTLITSRNFQQAWIDASLHLADNQWECRNLIVHIENSTDRDDSIHHDYVTFCNNHNLLGPKHVAYTIFPHNLYRRFSNASELFNQYNRQNGLYERIRTRWGTYFRRMTFYDKDGKVVNQLSNIISAINSRKKVQKSAYTIVIQKPGSETIRLCGGPCLNYIALQLKPGSPQLLGILAIYRNHDFLNKAYGNYWGLCNLICFLAKESGFNPGPLTCISSHAYIDGHKQDLKKLLGNF